MFLIILKWKASTGTKNEAEMNKCLNQLVKNLKKISEKDAEIMDKPKTKSKRFNEANINLELKVD